MKFEAGGNTSCSRRSVLNKFKIAVLASSENTTNRYACFEATGCEGWTPPAIGLDSIGKGG